MEVSYAEPLRRAWARTERILFRPFLIERWLVLGFAAFLAHLAHPGSIREASPGMAWVPRTGFFDAATWLGGGLPFAVWGFGQDGGVSPQALFGGLVALPFLALGLVVSVLLLWLSSRGQLVFLAGAVRGEGAIAVPWREHGRLGDSLFLWGLLAFAVVGAVGMAMAGSLIVAQSLPRALFLLQAAATFLLLVPVLLVVALVLLLTIDFVVPVMFARRVGVVDGWRAFLPLLRDNAASFAVYVLVVILARVVVGVLLAILAVLTCCILPAVLFIPYVGSVVLLPLSLVARLYSVEFLGQLGEQWSLPAAEDTRTVSTSA